MSLTPDSDEPSRGAQNSEPRADSSDSLSVPRIKLRNWTGRFQPSIDALGNCYCPERDLPELTVFASKLARLGIRHEKIWDQILPKIIRAARAGEAAVDLPTLTAPLITIAATVAIQNSISLRFVEESLPKMLQALARGGDVANALPVVVQIVRSAAPRDGETAYHFFETMLPYLLERRKPDIQFVDHLRIIKQAFDPIFPRFERINNARVDAREREIPRIVMYTQFFLDADRLGQDYILPEYLQYSAVAAIEGAGHEDILIENIEPTASAKFGLSEQDYYTVIGEAHDLGIFGSSALIEAMYSGARTDIFVDPRRLGVVRALFPLYIQSPHRAVAAAAVLGEVLAVVPLESGGEPELVAAAERITARKLPLTFVSRAAESQRPLAFLAEGLEARTPPAIAVSLGELSGGLDAMALDNWLEFAAAAESALSPITPMMPLARLAFRRLKNISHSFGEFTAPGRPIAPFEGSLLSSVARAVGSNVRLVGGSHFPGRFTLIEGLVGHEATHSQLRLLIGRRFHVVYDPVVANVGLIIFNDHFEQPHRAVRRTYLFEGNRFSQLVRMIEAGVPEGHETIETLNSAIGPVGNFDFRWQKDGLTPPEIEAAEALCLRWEDFQWAYADVMRQRALLPENSPTDIPLYDWFREFFATAPDAQNFGFGPSHIYWGAQYAPIGSFFVNPQNRGLRLVEGLPASELFLRAPELRFDGSPGDRERFMEMVRAMPEDCYPALVDLRYVLPIGDS